MQELLDYQKAFYKAIFTNDPKIVENFIGPVEDFEKRFGIYSNNIFSSLKNVIKDDFPISRKILGKQKFNQASFEFVRRSPPTSGCLLKYGQKFPFFLNAFFPEYPYIQDLAQIEWAKKELYYKEDSIPLNPQVIYDIPVDDYPFLSFEFPKATFLFKSSYSLEKMWPRIEKGEQSIKKNNSYFFMIRPRFKIHHHWLSAEEFHFLRMLYEKKNLREAYDNAIFINSQFNLSEALTLALKREYFTKVTIDYNDRKAI